MLKQLATYLREKRSEIVCRKDVLVEVYDPTHGLQDPRCETIEYVDFDALIEAIDDFAREFKK